MSHMAAHRQQLENLEKQADAAAANAARAYNAMAGQHGAADHVKHLQHLLDLLQQRDPDVTSQLKPLVEAICQKLAPVPSLQQPAEAQPANGGGSARG